MISSTGTPQRPSGWLRPRAVESSDAKQAAASRISSTPCSGCACTARARAALTTRRARRAARPSVQRDHTGVRRDDSASWPGSRPRSRRLSSGSWKSLPREASRPNSSAISVYLATSPAWWLPVTTSHAFAAVRLELGEQRVLLGRRELVAARVRDDGHAAGGADPAHGVAQPGPAMLDVARLAFGEVAAEDGVHVGRDAAGDQEAAEVRARDEVGVRRQLDRAFVGALDADHAPGRRPSAWRAARVRRAPAAMPATSSSLDGSMPRPTMCTVVLAKVTEISMPSTNGRPAAAAAARAAGRPLSSSWSVSAHSSTPLAFARAASAAAPSVPSEAVEWLWRSALRSCTAAILASARCPCRGKWEPVTRHFRTLPRIHLPWRRARPVREPCPRCTDST